MIRSVHATLGIFRPFDEALAALTAGLGSVGQPGPSGSRLVHLEGMPSQDFLMRAAGDGATRRSRKHSWRLLLSSPAPAPSGTPVVDAQLTLEAVTKNACGLRLNGRDTHDIGTLGLGSMNGYALSLLRQLDLAMHLRDAHYGAATPHTPSL